MSSTVLMDIVNEKDRIKALRAYEVLDTISEKEYDHITRLASIICNTPISLISLIDKERQWFKSKYGIDVDETPRDQAFCDHAIRTPHELMEVHDATKDDRFKDNPLVIGKPYIKFYASAPIVASNGIPLGTLCVIDENPRKLQGSQKSALKSLSEMVVHLLEATRERKKYETFFESTSDLIYKFDEEGRLLYFNQSVERTLGYSTEEMRSLRCWDFIHEKYKSSVVRYYRKIVEKKEKSEQYEFPILTKQGDTVWLNQSVEFLYDEDGTPYKAYVIAKDISDAKRKNEELAHQKLGLQLLTEISSNTSLNLEERLEEGLKIGKDFLGLDSGLVNEVKSDFGYSIKTFPSVSHIKPNTAFPLAMTYSSIAYHKEELVAVDELSSSEYKDNLAHLKFGHETYIGTSYHVKGKKHGTVNFLSQNKRYKPFQDYEIDFFKIFSKWVGYMVEQSITEKELLMEQHILKSFVLSAPAAIAMFDKEIKYLAASQKWYNDYRIDGDIIGVSHYDVFPEISKEWKSIYNRVLQGEVVRRDKDPFERLEGSTQWLEWEIRPWHNKEGKIGGIIIYTHDITERIQLERDLIKAKEIAEKSGKIKEQFLSTMSHEIRTPLNAIIGTTHLMELEKPELAEDEQFQLLKFGSNNLLSLINDVLDYQKIESGFLTLDISEFNLKQLLENIINTWKPLSKDRGILLELKYDPALPTQYAGDKIRISQILNNLISNALKFTEDGMIILKLTGSKNGLKFEVKDTGIGIPADRLDHIFESFRQVDNQLKDKVGGTGLGLSIAQKLVEVMGGHLNVNSSLGLGTVFHFTIELQALNKKGELDNSCNACEQEMLKVDPLSVLIVEDNPGNQAVALGFLTRWGIKAEVANNGIEGIEKVKSKKYQLVLMDLMMPEMNGYEAVKTIRSFEDAYFKELPIIALTASTSTESKEKIRNAGMNSYVSKPFDPDLLYKIIVEVTSTSIDTRFSDQESKAGSFKFLSRLFKNQELKEIIETTILSVENSLEILESNLENPSIEEIRKVFHQLNPNLSHLDRDDLARRLSIPKDPDALKSKLPGIVSDIKGQVEVSKKKLVEME